MRILVKHPFDDKEIADLARVNSRNSLQLGELNAQLGAVKKDYGSKIESLEAEMSRVFNLVSSGFEMREENALVIFHPKEKIKKFYQMNPDRMSDQPGVFIREEPMQPSDYQKALPLPVEGEGEEKKLDKGFEPTVLTNEEAEKLESGSGDAGEDDELIAECIEVIRSEGKATVALFQRRLRLGYTRASYIMDELEKRGVVGPAQGAEPRDILIDLGKGSEE